MRSAARVFLKAETLQRTGSFKFRGAYNKIASIPPSGAAAGVVAYSSGNHAQGVAAARLLGMRATIVMPADAPKAKRDRTSRSVLRSYPTIAIPRIAPPSPQQIMTERGATLVPPYDDPLIIAGQGTIGAEIVEDLAKLLVEARGGGRRCLR